MKKAEQKTLLLQPLMLLVLSLWCSAALLTIAAFFQLVQPWLSVVLIAPLICMFILVLHQLRRWSHRTRLEKGLVFFLIVVWISHLVQCFTPETGFDAVWYHLPVIKLIVTNNGFAYSPELYQSVNPLFSDLLFLAGYQLKGETGAKLIGYFLALTLAIVSFALARLTLARTWALLFTIAVSLIQVVSWQSASAYIDVAKALWEVAAVYVLIVTYLQYRRGVIPQKTIWLQLTTAALLFGASLASKHFSIALLPTMLLMIWLLFHRWKYVIFYGSVSLFVLLPFDWRSYVLTGDPFYSMTHHFKTFSAFGNYATPAQQLLQRGIRLPYSLLTSLTVRDYISPLLVLTLPLLFWLVRYWKKLDRTAHVLVLFLATQWLVWWIVPPLSTRYALSGFIILLLLITQMLAQFSSSSEKRTTWVLVLYCLILVTTALPRFYVNFRSWQYISGKQTKTEYIKQFYDGSIDQKLQDWHDL